MKTRPKFAGYVIRKGDAVRRINNPNSTGIVTYVSPTEDYAEIRYASGFHFRTRKSEWIRIVGEDR